MNRPAKVQSTEAIRNFRADLINFRDELRQHLDLLLIELRKAVDYFESERPVYWANEARKASDRLSEARLNLHRCQVTSRSGEGPSCYDERKALERAKLRLQTAETKIRATKKAIRIVSQAVDDFRTRLSQLDVLVDHDLNRGIQLLQRLSQRLDRYTGHSSIH